ncbi:uncharacterized protein [Rutidosis leptorrhynchoides]|uniref:uncharacterized protein n=1 Tax=Rutidosis leptorrhynchoides TaxID=125765 RepID=UPI003A9A51D6
MADFEAPSFSLGFDFTIFDSEPRIGSSNPISNRSSSGQFSVAATTKTLEDNDDDFETLIVDDSEPEYLDQNPELKRIRRGLSISATSSTIPCNDETKLHSTAVIDDCCVRRETSYVIESVESSATGSLRECLLPAHRYFCHDDPRIQELVRSRLPNFSPLDNVTKRDFEKPSTSEIDYMGQFKCGQSSNKKKNSRKSKTEDMSDGWVNPKLGVDKVTTKRAVKRKVHGANHTPGRWLTGSDGKKVYVGKRGQELTGRVAYCQYKKESGAGFMKAKRKSSTKKKK